MKVCVNINQNEGCEEESLGCEGCYYYRDADENIPENEDKIKEGE